MMKMDIVEKIAREICWREFSTPPKYTTKAAYWRSVSIETRDELMKEARRFIWVYHNIPVDLLNETVQP